MIAHIAPSAPRHFCLASRRRSGTHVQDREHRRLCHSATRLVGNFGDGFIHVFNPTTGAPLATLNNPQGNPIFIDGLWALQFGNGANAGPTSSLFFTAGPNGEADGLFGVLAQAPEPGAWVLAGVALPPLLRRLRR
ncbi:MAG TPA: TIGR03118 family protein [Candidatus Solibacter sp.]|nr:TIGR03118 family protein [Candidatus Solibacter sp.]